MKIFKRSALSQRTHHLSHLAIVISLPYLLIPGVSVAAVINGDFTTNDLYGWSQDVDGLGSPTQNLNDFSTVETASNNSAAHIEIDYFSTSGDSTSTPQDEALFANTFYQSLDLSLPANTTSQQWKLSFDWEFSGEQVIFDENFIVGLSNGSGNYFDEKGNPGFLLNPSNYGSGSFNTQFDASFADDTEWSLEFQLNSGTDGFGSYFQIDNVNLENVAIENVPIPGALWLFGSSLFGLGWFKRRS